MVNIFISNTCTNISASNDVLNHAIVNFYFPMYRHTNQQSFDYPRCVIILILHYYDNYSFTFSI